MEIVPIKTERDYRRTLKEIEGLMTAKRNTPEGDRLDVLVTLVEAWEARIHPLDLPDPIDAIRARKLFTSSQNAGFEGSASRTVSASRNGRFKASVSR